MSYRTLHEFEYEYDEEDDDLKEGGDGDDGDDEEEEKDDWEPGTGDVGDWDYGDGGGGDGGGGDDKGDGRDDFSYDFEDSNVDGDEDNDGDAFMEREERRREHERQAQEFERQRQEAERQQLAEAYRQQQEQLEEQERQQQEMLDEQERQRLAGQQAPEDAFAANALAYTLPGEDVQQVPEAEVPIPGELQPDIEWDTDDPTAWVAVQDKRSRTNRWIPVDQFDPERHQQVDERHPALGPPPGQIAHLRRIGNREYSRSDRPLDTGAVASTLDTGIGAAGQAAAETGSALIGNILRQNPAPGPVFSPPPPFSPGDRRVPDEQAAADAAARAAAEATAATGAGPQQVANAAATAAVRALDKQTFAQQTPWTKMAFQARYGANAANEWAREHNAELARNERIYGSREPAPGTPALEEGVGRMPDRRIGATPPPGPGLTARYGVNQSVPSAPGTNGTTLAPRVPGTAAAPGAPAVINPGNVLPGSVKPPASESSVLPGTAPRWTPPPGYEPGDRRTTIYPATHPAGTPPPGARPTEPGIAPAHVDAPSSTVPPAAPPAVQLPPYSPPPDVAPAPLPVPDERPYDPDEGARELVPPPVPFGPGDAGTVPVQGRDTEKPDDWIDVHVTNQPQTRQTFTRSEWDSMDPVGKAQWTVDNARPADWTPDEGSDRPDDRIDLTFTADPRIKITRTRAQWDATPLETQSKWTVINARPLAPVQRTGAHPTDAHASTGWLDLRDEATASLPSYQLPQGTGQRDIALAQEILANGEFVPGNLQPVDDATAEAMFSPDNLQAAIPAGGLSPLYPSQGDLATPAKWAACGPVAIMALAASKGIAITEAQAIAAATKAGWTPAQGMAGPASQVKALQDIGVPAEMGPIDVRRIQESIRNGDPVTLSSPGSGGHYFVVENVDEYGRMDLGNTVTTLAVNPKKERWFTVEEMKQKLGSFGQVDTAIYVKNPSKPGDTVVANLPGGAQPQTPGQPPRVQSPVGVAGAQIAQGAPVEATISLTRPPEGVELATETALSNIDTQAPLGTILTLAGIQQDDPQLAARTHDWVIEGMGNWLQGDQNASWAEPYLNDVARLAYSLEERGNGRATDPRLTPSNYINAWKDGFYGGDQNVPLVRQLRQELGLGGPGQYQITVPRGTLSPRYGPGSPSPSTGPERIPPTQMSQTDRRTLPPILATAKPARGLVAGQAEPLDQMATIWDDAMNVSNGDTGFADGIAALLIGEGGLRGGVGDTGQSFGPYQFYWGGGEGNAFEAWLPTKLGRPVTRAEAQQMAKNVDLANEFYLPKVYEYYKKGIGQYPNNPIHAIAVGGHNRRAPQAPSVWRNYQEAWDNWKAGNPEQKNTVQSGSAVAPPPREPNMNVMLRQMSNRAYSGDQGEPATPGGGQGAVDLLEPPQGNPRFPVDPRPNPTYDWEGVDRTNDPLIPMPEPLRPPTEWNDRVPPYRIHDDPRITVARDERGRPIDDTRMAMMSPTARMSDLFAQAADRDAYPTEGPQVGTVGDTPWRYRAAADAPAFVPWYDQAKPEGVETVDQPGATGMDVGAAFWNEAYEQSGGDARFATLAAGLVNGEGGFSGRVDEVGAHGLFQFDPRYAEGKEFARWLREQGIDVNPQEASKNIKLSSGYYLKYIKDAYDDAVKKGVSDETGLMRAMVTGPSRRGYGHNSGSSGANFKNYTDGLAEFKRGVFRLRRGP